MRLIQEGQVIRGTYEVERFLGEGAFAEVYRVKHRFLGRQAMKVFKTVGTIQETEQALEEAIMLSQIGHPNIVRVFDANITETSNGSCGFFTMEYVAGGSLEQFWRSHGDQFVPVETAVEIMRQVCRGMEVAHKEKPPIIHRDIKPQNILVGYDVNGLRARVSDFGLAKRVNPLTWAASARGTRCFKAPETFRNPLHDSCAGDVWALGLTLYLLITDQLPYSGADLDAVDLKSFERPMMPASYLNIQVNPALDQILFRALAVKRDDRYQNAAELLEELVNWRPDAAVPIKPPKSAMSSEAAKSVFGEQHTPANEKKAREMAAQAVKLSRQTGRLMEAADLMEEAFNRWPELREQYEYQLKLWRRGIVQ
ncbi:MAG TPA: serine/threonine-protein kinase [Pyrinomonadaceae bacterium]|jgi:serine/threonine-protein kinase